MRAPQPVGHAGSLRWIQKVVERYPERLRAPLCAAGALPPAAGLDWVSPRAADNWAEYRDADFLAVLGRADLAPRLRAFWPARGPQWDALARGRDGDATIVLVEAKAHVGELASSCAAESAASRAQIDAAFVRTRAALGVLPGADWLRGYYQFANRLAHLHFLRAECDVPAYLLCVYFTADTQMQGPTNEAAWAPALAAMYTQLGLERSRPLPGVVDVFLPVADLV